jgi:hypothetical protein
MPNSRVQAYMNRFYMAALTCLIFVAGVEGQRSYSSSVCARPDKTAREAILTICTHARGMTSLPQPRLYLRVFADGRAEYEHNPRVPEGDPRGYEQLVIKELRITQAELHEILCLAGEPDFQAADSVYKRIYIGNNTSMTTTVIFRDVGRAKKIVLNNYTADGEDNVEHYPSSLNALMDRVQWIWERANGIVRTIPTITFCELMLNRKKYLGKPIGIYADLEHHASPTRDLKHVSIDEFLHDLECDRLEVGNARTREKIGIAYPDDAAEAAALRMRIAKLRGEPFHSRARVLVFGTLRKDSNHLPYEYEYQFEIGEFKSIEPIILPYQGTLKNGWTYSDTFDHAGGPNIKLSSRLKPRLHYAERIDWKYTGHTALINPGRKHIVFRVSYVTTHMIAPDRWDETYTCEILELK